MPPPTLKRARPHSTNLSSSSVTPTAGVQPATSSALPGAHSTSRAKRRKPEPVNVEKEREKESENEIKTKIDFNDLPVETLYKYLEAHDLLPRWDPSPWSEEPCIPPNQLYMIPPSAPTPVPPPSAFLPNQDPSPPPEPTLRTSSMAPGTEEDIKPTMSAVDAGAVDTGAVDTGTVDTSVNDTSAVDIGAVGTGATESAAIDTGDAGAADGTTITSEEKAEQINGVEETHQSTNDQVEEGETTIAAAAAPSGQGETTAEQLNGPITSTDQPTASAEPSINPEVPSDIPPTSDAPPASPHSTPPPPTPPTTRSKTLPSRRPATPAPPSPPPPPVIRRGVMTLSDVLAAKHVLAEKANAHWAKGLGGGQNKESETIVNFLYKMKVGPGRLLRVYNPMTSTQPPWL
ncbi:hypothetical protein I314_05316 [Cryptococcus bacillisporus CA1873]|uniref:Uncharacterized protein n=1 Tax=Cryptococcus bacillisporus CA1873 TaxID=1296111 RepID=A0ABR5B5M5_CRYGA|nr:hypothetical protein I314_05316 [Cryptococcus bacillisporus CA1873]|eukprot:KIR58903.1 hypothetical protein I314_05316 [Cryptococcus gattii CA1873]